MALLLVGAGFLLWLGISLGSALTNPALGSSLGARFAEWARANGGASIVNWAENQWYSHHQPKVGGKLPAGAIHRPKSTPTAVVGGPPHLAPPAPMQPFASPAVPGEGQWSPAGRRVGGIPALYVTTLRPDAVHTSYVVRVAWMDTKLLRATLYSGSQIPGGGPYTNTAPIQPQSAKSLVAAFNAGFLMSAANGGYYTDGKTILPLRNGAASFVVYRNGTSTIGQWGRDVSMTPDVVSVRQNLDLLVDNGQPVAGLNAADTTQWGATLGNAVYVWRSGLGVTANGALVYVGGPDLNITDLAALLARAGAVRAMELDINTDWVNLSYYDPSTPSGPATSTNGHRALAGDDRDPGPLLPELVGSGLHHHVGSDRLMSPIDMARAPQAAVSSRIGPLVRALRPRQWGKNLLVFLAPAAAGVLGELFVFLHVLGALGIFCAAAAGTYLINDVLDAEADRQHPDKQHRPVASGAVPGIVALVVGVSLAVGATITAWPLAGWRLTLVVGAYVAVSIGYSLYLKHQPVVELATVASCFVLRAVAGGVAANVPLSNWFLVVTSFGALFVVTGKRSAEVSRLGDRSGEHRPVLASYTPSFLRSTLTLSASVAATAYFLWAFEASGLSARAGTRRSGSS